MKLTGNTVLVTGGGSGIGRGLAEAFHKAGNQVIVSGRRKSALAETVAANPGMQSVELDVQSPASIRAVAEKLVAEFPGLNVLVNNAGMMKFEDIANGLSEEVLTSTVETNLYGPIRMTEALLPHLKQQERAAVLNVTSGLAFVPMAPTATYCATKAALHSWTLSLRFALRKTGVKVIEVAPPYVQTELTGGQQKNDPRAMPLAEYLAETWELLQGDADEILVERVKRMRNAVGPEEWRFVQEYNQMMVDRY
jgi:uncharacterized oxidoreductase